jgi:hypothetical protein
MIVLMFFAIFQNGIPWYASRSADTSITSEGLIPLKRLGPAARIPKWQAVTWNNILAKTQLPMHLRRRKNDTFAYAPPRQSWGQNSICGLGKVQIRMFTFHRFRV